MGSVSFSSGSENPQTWRGRFSLRAVVGQSPPGGTGAGDGGGRGAGRGKAGGSGRRPTPAEGTADGEDQRGTTERAFFPPSKQ